MRRDWWLVSFDGSGGAGLTEARSRGKPGIGGKLGRRHLARALGPDPLDQDGAALGKGNPIPNIEAPERTIL